MCFVKVTERSRSTDRWLRQHWVVNSLVQASAMAITWLVVGLILGGSGAALGALAVFVVALGIGLFVRGWWSPERS
jgi:hypothetical protein